MADFLRGRRERITPEMVSLPAGPRRRTPGLRREEVAQLSYVGVTWYTWLEQARDIQVSAHVLDAIARTLLLDSHERAHLFVLAGLPDPAASENQPTVSTSVRLTLQQLEPLPACVINGRYDILAYNTTYGLLVEDLDALPAPDRNVMWLIFTHPAWHDALIDRDDMIRQCTAQFRAAMAEHIGEKPWTDQLTRLKQSSAEFQKIWRNHDVTQPYNHATRFLNPHVGILNMEHTSLWFNPRSDNRMAVHTPLDDDTRTRLEQLHTIARTRHQQTCLRPGGS